MHTPFYKNFLAAAAFLSPPLVALPALLLLLPAAIPPAQAAESLNAIVAIVNNKPITRLEIEQEIKWQPGSAIPAKNREQQALDRLIDRALQLQLAQLIGVRIPDNMLEERLDDIQKEFNLPDRKALEKATQERFALSYDDFREQVREDMKIQSVFYNEIFRRTEVYEDEVDQFLLLEADIVKNREYLLRYILISTAEDGEDLDDKRDLAVSLKAALDGGAKFEDLAKRHSEDASSEDGGLLGYKKENELPTSFLAELHNLRIGETSDIITTSRGFHILKIEARRGGNIPRSITEILISHIFFTEEDQALAEEVKRDISDRTDFNLAVLDYSIDPNSRDSGGQLGWFEENKVPPYFADAVAELQVGDISPPVQSPYGWHILLIEDSRSKEVQMQALRDQARQVLRERRALAQRELWLRQLRSDAHVRILDPAFEQDAR